MDLKSKINSAKKSNSGWDDDLKNTINGQKNIIKSMRARIASLMEERNRLRDNDNGVISTDPIKYRDLVNTTDNQRKIIKTLRSRISTLSKERNKLIEDKSGGSNKYLITSLENELNSLQIRYDVILKQRDKFRKAAAQGGTNLSATEDKQRKIIKTLRERISSLIKERNTLRSENYIASNKSSNLKKSEARITQLDSEVAQLKGSIKFLRNKFGALQREKNKLQASIDSSVGNSTVDKNQLSNLQNKYQKLYIENNTTKIDFDKLERKYKQLIIDVTALERENTKLQVSIDSSDRNSTVDENQLNDLQNKYQKLYTENNVIKIDFDKLDKKYKQLASDFEAKGNDDVQRLTKANEELSISLQKQKILAYDAISQKSTLEEDIKITRAEANKLSKQLSDLNNVATLNSSLKSDLSEARYQINSLKEELEISKNGATADLDKANAKIAELEDNLKKSKNDYAELESQISNSETSQQKGFVLSSEWDELKQWITPQQIRFCTILSDYDREKVAAQESGNQLKQNLAIDNRDADIDALLLGRNSQEKGYFRNWIGTVEQVFAIYQENANGDEELAAGVVIKTPCDNVTVGSGRVKSADDERYEGTAFPSDPIYTQLSQVSKGDPILFEGSLLTYQDTGEANRSSKPRFFTNVDSSVNDVEAEKAKKKDKINAPDYFVKIDYLSKL
jgi:chromosome segregation ATPase